MTKIDSERMREVIEESDAARGDIEHRLRGTTRPYSMFNAKRDIADLEKRVAKLEAAAGGVPSGEGELPSPPAVAAIANEAAESCLPTSGHHGAELGTQTSASAGSAATQSKQCRRCGDTRRIEGGQRWLPCPDCTGTAPEEGNDG